MASSRPDSTAIVSGIFWHVSLKLKSNLESKSFKISIFKCNDFKNVVIG